MQEVSVVTKALNFLQDGKVEEYVKSDEIPEKNDFPVKVVVRKSFNQMVLESGKNGEFALCNGFQIVCQLGIS